MNVEETIADDSLQEQGIWIPFRDGAEFLIAYSDRKKARDKVGRISMRARRANRGRDLETSQADDAWSEAAVGVILLDWKGITRQGADFPFNRENAIWLLKNSAPIRDFILSEAGNINNFQKEGTADAEDTGPLAATKSGADVSTATG